MAKLILASVLCIFLLVKGIKAGEVATGVSCAAESDTCAATDYCEADVCKIKEAGTCTSGSTNNCIANAECPATGDNQDKCTCENGYTANADKTVCGADAGTSGCGTALACVSTATCDTSDSTCKIKAGQTCTTVDTQSNCIEEATCKGTDNLVCTCNDEHTASTDSTQCVANLDVGAKCPEGTTCMTTATCETVGDVRTCKQKIEQACTVATQCVSGAECPTEGTNNGKCTCKAGSTASQDKTKCGAMSIAASMLLVVATFVTSRFL